MQPINIVLSLESAEALAKMNHFLEEASNGLRNLATRAVEAFISLEGLNKLVDIGKDILTLQENIGKLSQQTGVSVDAIAALRDVSTKIGLPFDQLSTTLGRFSQNVYVAATTGGRAADAFTAMHISLLNADGSLRATDVILREFLEKFQQMPDGPQKTSIAMDVSGRSAREAIPALNQAAEAFQHLGESGISDATVNQATDFNRTLRELAIQVEELAIKILQAVMPALIQLAHQMESVAQQARDNKDLIDFLANAFKGLITVVYIAYQGFDVLGMTVGYVANLFVDNWNVAIKTAWQITMDYVNALKDVVTLLKDVGLGIVSLVGAQQALLTGHLGTAKDLVVGTFTDIKNDIGSLTHDAVGIFADAGLGASQVFQNTAHTADGLLDQFSAKALDMMRFLDGLWNGEAKTGPAVKPEASKIFPPQTQSIKDLSTINSLIAEIYKQQEKLIQNDPFKSQSEKAQELLALLTKQRDLIIEEYSAAERALGNPNLNDQQKLEIKKDMVKLQGQLNDLEQQEQQIQMKGDFKLQMQAGIVKLNDQITDFSTNSANLALTTLQRGVDAVSQSIYAAMQGTKNWGEAFGRAMNQAVQGIIQMVTQYIAGKLAMMAVDAAYGSASKAQSASTTAASVPAGIAKAGEQGGWVGILIYVGVFLAAMAALMAIASAVGRERGGPVSARTPYIVGEKRPELFVPEQNGYILPEVPSPTASSGMATGAAPTVNLSFHGGEADAAKYLRSQDGQNFIVDTNRKTVTRFTR